MVDETGPVDSSEGTTLSKPGEKKAATWQFLLRENVAGQLLFTADMARRISEELKVSESYPWDIVRRFETEGLVKRVQRSREEGGGILITFLNQKPERKEVAHSATTAKKFSADMSLLEAKDFLEKEVQDLRAKLSTKEGELKMLSNMIGGKK